MKPEQIKDFGHKKLTAYFASLIRSDEFLIFTKNLRKKYGIPSHGYSSKPNKKHQEFPPKEWVETHGVEKYANFIEELTEFCKEKGLFFADYIQWIQYLIFADTTKRPFNIPDFHFLLITSDVIEEKEWKRTKKTIENEDTNFPVALRISPYASKRDILEYVEKNYTSEIKPVQEKYKEPSSKIGKLKSRDPEVQECSDFIYAHKDLKYSEISKLLGGRYGRNSRFNYTTAEIGKIISLERKRRTEL